MSVTSWLIVIAVLLSVTTALGANGKLAVHVVDADTGQTLPARLVLHASDGSYPGDRLACPGDRWPNLDLHGVFINGQESFDLPPGKTTLTGAHGFEYRTDSRSVEVIADQTVTVELKLKRAYNLRQAGWVAGEGHFHMIHGEQQRTTSYEDVATTCAGNGLDFASVCQEYVGAGKLDLKGYQAQCSKVSTKDFKLFLGGERPKSILGHLAILGVNDPFLIPEDPPYHEGARAVHDQGGILYYVHPVRYYPGKQWSGEWLDLPGNNLGRELIFDAYAGPSFDGLSVLSDEPANPDAHQLWFNLLNRGFFVPAFADCDACFDRPTLGWSPPGFWNTYYYIGADTPVEPAALVQAVRRGRTMASTGPLLQFRIDDHLSGDTLPTDGVAHTVTIEAYYAQHAWTLETVDRHTQKPVGVARVELIRNGQVVQTWTPNTPLARLTHRISETQACWYAVRVYGSDEQWQVAVVSPIYFAPQPVPAKRPPFVSTVRGRIYDFVSGQERSGTVEVHRGGKLLKSFEATGQFRLRMPLDAEVIVKAPGVEPIVQNLLLDYGPVQKFMWYLESKDMGQVKTLDRFESLVKEVELEFPLGYKLPGCYIAKELAQALPFQGVRVLEGPPAVSGGTVAIAAVLVDTVQVQTGDTIHVAVIYHDEGDPSKLGPLVVEARGYDPARPTGYGAMKKFAEFEKTWATATDLGQGYKMVAGQLAVPAWVKPGHTGAIDLSVMARSGDRSLAFIGLEIPLGPTRRAVCLANSWPIMPISWPDRFYGLGPLNVTNRIGRLGQPRADYRLLHLEVSTPTGMLDLLPARDGRGCADADDAVYTQKFLDQVLNNESHLATPDPIRPQPKVTWREDLAVVDATGE